MHCFYNNFYHNAATCPSKQQDPKTLKDTQKRQGSATQQGWRPGLKDQPGSTPNPALEILAVLSGLESQDSGVTSSLCTQSREERYP